MNSEYNPQIKAFIDRCINSKLKYSTPKHNSRILEYDLTKKNLTMEVMLALPTMPIEEIRRHVDIAWAEHELANLIKGE